jgi:uncharacterized protein YuzE
MSDDDALYFRLNESAIVGSKEVRPGVNLDFDKDGQVVGVECLGIKARMPEEKLSSLRISPTTSSLQFHRSVIYCTPTAANSKLAFFH